MANSPSHRWENGVLVERAIDTSHWTDEPVDNDEKAVQAAENKAVSKATKKTAKKK